MNGGGSQEAGVAELLRAVGARAAGLWTVEPTRLVQAAFVACAEMPAAVAAEFAAATRVVPLTDRSLGIVAAVAAGTPWVSRASELDAASGSGRWLRAFGAERSVAVPLADATGRVAAVLSVALGPSEEPDDAVAARVRAAGRALQP
jgi:hypothetical protein